MAVNTGDWKNIIGDVLKRYEEMPAYTKKLYEPYIREAIERQKRALAQRGLLGSSFGRASLARTIGDLARQQEMAEMARKREQIAGLSRIGSLLAGIEQQEKARQQARDIFEKQFAFKKKVYEESKPKWYDYLLAALQSITGSAQQGVEAASAAKMAGFI